MRILHRVKASYFTGALFPNEPSDEQNVYYNNLIVYRKVSYIHIAVQAPPFSLLDNFTLFCAPYPTSTLLLLPIPYLTGGITATESRPKSVGKGREREPLHIKRYAVPAEKQAAGAAFSVYSQKSAFLRRHFHYRTFGLLIA